LAEQSIPVALGIVDHAYVLQTGHTVPESPAHTLRRDQQLPRIDLGV
jgi:ABC-type branched-subunit amino acid transport system ATPase component